MIFIKDKKAFKAFIKKGPISDFLESPKEYPCYLKLIGVDAGFNPIYDCAYKSDLQSMIDKIDSGREF